jgi:hypothetical protein
MPTRTHHKKGFRGCFLFFPNAAQQQSKKEGSLVFLPTQASVGVGNLDGELLGTFNDQLPLLGRNAVSDLGAVLLVLHHQNFQLLWKIYKPIESIQTLELRLS